MTTIISESIDSCIAKPVAIITFVTEATIGLDPIDGRTSRWAHRRPELLAAATAYVLDHGVADLTLRPLAEGIGVTIATVIRQFGSKEQLIESVARGIHERLLTDLRYDPALAGNHPLNVLQTLWSRWLEPGRAREFGLLFELYALALRTPDSYQWFLTTVVHDWLKPMKGALEDLGHSDRNAEAIATAVLALLRGLHLDLAATQDTIRVTAAFDMAMAAIAKDLDPSALPALP